MVDENADLIAGALAAEPNLERERERRKHAESENRRLRELLDRQQQLLDTIRQERLPITPAVFTEPTEAFVRVMIPDTHGSILNEGAGRAFLHDLKALAPAEIVMLGDHIDCGGFLAAHHTLGFVTETSYSFADDAANANRFLDAVQTAAPNASVYYIDGNHEERIEKWCVNSVMSSGKGSPDDIQMLMDVFCVDAVLSLADRGIDHLRAGVKRDDCRIPATLRLGNCYFTHGTRINKHAAQATLGDFQSNVVFGHTHRVQSYQSSNVKEGGIAAWNIGSLCEVQPVWANRRVTDWAHAYGVQFVQPEGDFLHMTIPIIDGKSLLVPLTRLVG